MSLIRDNLMTRPGYTPYCGSESCSNGMPRTHFLRGQFQCGCGWRSGFDPEFIAQYESKWESPGSDCEHRIKVTPRNGAPHGPGFACGLSGGHCLPKDGCGYTAPSPADRVTP